MQIIPIGKLQNTEEIERLCTAEDGPVYVTKNGYGRLVVMDIDVYERTIRQLYEAKLLLDGLRDVQDGNLRDGEAVFTELREQYGI